ncbi:Ig-like domain-containing protein (plasmid) [Pantoea sp. C3]|uniref:Ig-like domain-containing protein n=1 Tax=Pantoea phytostimulans TaxID=2769024 RepID=UPI0038F73627
MTNIPLNLTLLNDGMASQRVTLPQGKPFHLNAVAGNRYLITQGATKDASGPDKLKLSRKDNHLEVRIDGDEQPQLIILEYYEQPGDVLGVDARGDLHEYVSADAVSGEAEAFEDNYSAVMVMSRNSAGPLEAFYPINDYGFLKAAAAFAGLLGLGGVVLAMQNQHSGPAEKIPAPTIVQGHDNFGSVTGSLQQRAVTNDPSPDISGQGSKPGNIIHIYANGELQGSAVVGEDGSWIFTRLSLSEGTYQLTATETSVEGKVSPASVKFELNIDLTPPAVSIDSVTDDVGDLTSNISSGGLTNDNQPLLSGQSEPGALIEISIDGRVVGSVIAGADGSWAFQAPTLSEGEHRFSATATDTVGNTSLPTVDYPITIDTVAPDVSISTALDNVSGGIEGGNHIGNNGLTNDSRPVINGSAEPGSRVTIYDGVNAIASFVTTTANWTWQYPAGARFSDGTHLLTVRAVDPAGNVSAISESITFNVDTQAALPVLSGITDAVAGGVTGAIALDGTGLTNDSRPVISGSAEPGSRVTIYDGTNAIASFVTTTANWTWQHPAGARFSDGVHLLTVRAVDPAGNVSATSESITLNVDTQAAPPVLSSITDAVAGGVTGAIALDGTGLTNDSRPVISGSAEPGSLVTIYDGANAIGSFVTTTANWTWQYPAGARFSDGTHLLTVRAVDPAGNVSATSESITLNVDTQAAPPVLSSITDAVAGGVTGAIALDGTGLTNDSRPVISGSAEPGSLVTIYDGANAIGSFVTTTANWTWQYPAGARFSDGTHLLTVRAVDPAGNVSAISENITLNVDTQAATPVLISSTDAVAGGVTGAIANDGTGLTNDAQPMLQGTAEAGNLVTIYSGDVAVGSVRADAVTGAWSWQFTGSDKFDEGKHVLTVRVTDMAGNVSAPSESLSSPSTPYFLTQWVMCYGTAKR